MRPNILVYYTALQETMLFDRRSGPMEQRNLADQAEYQPVVT